MRRRGRREQSFASYEAPPRVVHTQISRSDSSVSRVGRSRRGERHLPMTVRLRPLNKPDGRISRIRLSESNSAPGFTPGARVRVDDVEVVETYPLTEPLVSIAPGAWTSIPPSLRPHYRGLLATIQDSDFQSDPRRLAGRTGLGVRLSLGNPLPHRLGSPRLSEAHLPDVLTTLTPTELAGQGDWVSCQQRPSHNAPEARRLRSFNITGLIGCGSSSFRPVGSWPGLLNPLQPRGWTGTWPFRREPPNSTGGTLTHELRTLRGLLRSGMHIVMRFQSVVLKLR